MSDSSVADLELELRRRFRVTETEIDVQKRSITILHPANSDELINEEDFVRDERMPYWADIWPSSRVLGAYLIDHPVADGAPQLLELGCGSGLVAVCAAVAGYQVTATDYDDNSLSFTRVNVVRNGGQEPTIRLVDWRAFPADLGRFDLVVASDVLYERAYAVPLAHAINMSLTRRGLAIIADPGRVAREAFIGEAQSRGLDVDASLVIPHPVGPVTQHITLLRIRRRPGYISR